MEGRARPTCPGVRSEEGRYGVADGALVHRDGRRVRFLNEGEDEGGEYLTIEHVWERPGPMAGPHWSRPDGDLRRRGGQDALSG